MPSFKGKPCTQEHEILSQKTRVFGAAYGKDFMILAYTILIQSQSVMDGRTDRRAGHGYDARSILLACVVKTTAQNHNHHT